MKQSSRWILNLCALTLAATTLTPVGMGAAYADDDRRDRYERKDRDHYDRDRYKDSREEKREKKYKDKHRYKERVIHHGPVYVVPKKRERRYRDVVVIRPYGHWYHGYGHYHGDSDAYKWLAFTAITLKLLDNLNEQQQREHESAQVKATTAPIGEKIIWNDGKTQGAVTPTREGTSTSGRYCREFLQEVTIAGKTEQAYGTACRQPDGTWEVISTGAQ